MVGGLAGDRLAGERLVVDFLEMISSSSEEESLEESGRTFLYFFFLAAAALAADLRGDRRTSSLWLAEPFSCAFDFTFFFVGVPFLAVFFSGVSTVIGESPPAELTSLSLCLPFAFGVEVTLVGELFFFPLLKNEVIDLDLMPFFAGVLALALPLLLLLVPAMM